MASTCVVLLEKCDNLLSGNGVTTVRSRDTARKWKFDNCNLTECFVLLEKCDGSINNSLCKEALQERKKLDFGTRSKVTLCQCMCGETFRSKILLLKHINSHREKPVHNYGSTTAGSLKLYARCPTCKQSLQRSVPLPNMSKHHPDNHEFVCSECNCKYATENHLTNHSCVSSLKKPYRCNFCDATFDFTRDLRQHFRTLHEMRAKCMKCSSVFLSDKDLTFHRRSCLKVVSRRRMGKKHLGLKKKRKPVQISMSKKSNCMTDKKPVKVYETNPVLKLGNTTMPGKQSKPVPSETASYSVNTKKSKFVTEQQSNLSTLSGKQELRTSKFAGRYKCLDCDASFGNVVYFKKHTESHRNLKLFHIPDVEALGSWKRELEANLNQTAEQESDSDVDIITCDLSNNNDMGSDTTYNCVSCSATLHTKEDLLKHEQCHLQIGTYKCTDCEAVFQQALQLLEHTSAYHNLTQSHGSVKTVDINEVETGTMQVEENVSAIQPDSTTCIATASSEESFDSTDLQSALLSAQSEENMEDFNSSAQKSNTFDTSLEENLTHNPQSVAIIDVHSKGYSTSTVQHLAEFDNVILPDDVNTDLTRINSDTIAYTGTEFIVSANEVEDCTQAGNGNPAPITEEVTEFTNLSASENSATGKRAGNLKSFVHGSGHFHTGVDLETAEPAEAEYTEFLILPEGSLNPSVETVVDEIHKSCSSVPIQYLGRLAKSVDRRTVRIAQDEKLFALAPCIRPEIQCTHVSDEGKIDSDLNPVMIAEDFTTDIYNGETVSPLPSTSLQVVSCNDSQAPNLPFSSKRAGQVHRYKHRLNSHKKPAHKFHLSERKRMCRYCRQRFESKMKLLVHLHHCQPKIVTPVTQATGNYHKCDQCKASFTRKCSLERHALIHSTPRPHKCLECNSAFRNEVYLSRHLSTYHKKKRVCNVKQSHKKRLICSNLKSVELQEFASVVEVLPNVSEEQYRPQTPEGVLPLAYEVTALHHVVEEQYKPHALNGVDTSSHEVEVLPNVVAEQFTPILPNVDEKQFIPKT